MKAEDRQRMKMYNKPLLEKLAKYFAEHGVPKSYFDFKRDGKKPVSDKIMISKVGGYQRVLQLIRQNHPEYWSLAQPLDNEQPVKKDPLAALRAGIIEK